MKKKNIGLVSLFVGLLIFGGCTKGNTKSNESEKTFSSTSSIVESSSESTKTSSSSATQTSTSTPSSTESSNSSAFKLMVEASQSQLPALKEQMGQMYKDISITEGENQTLILIYTLAEQPAVSIDMEALKPTLAKGMKTMMDSANSMFGDIKIQVIYLNPDGSEIGNVTITQADVDAVSDDAS